jgi:uncharacterized membrane protein
VAFAISADGTTLVGDSSAIDDPVLRGIQAFRWVDGVMTPLALPSGCPDDRSTEVSARKVSADGRVILGHAFSFTDPGRCDGDVLWQSGLPMLLGYDGNGCPLELDQGGQVVLGDSGAAFVLCRSFLSNERRLIRWHGNTASELDLPILTSDDQAAITAVSPDESVFVGQTEFAGRLGSTAARWTRQGVTDLGELLCAASRHFTECSNATDLSADGSVAVGYADTSPVPYDQNEPFRWEAGVMRGLGSRFPPELRLPASTATAVSADGSIVVGFNSGFDVEPGGNYARSYEAFVWDPTHGHRDLQVLLARAYPVLTEGWTSLGANDISADGRIVVGEGFDPDGHREGWIARLPFDVELDIRPGDPANAIPAGKPVRVPVAVLGSESFDVTSIDTATLAFGPDGAAPEATPAPRLRDANGDGYPDLVAFFRADTAGLDAGDTEACLIGDSVDGERLLGCDGVRSAAE